MMSFNLNKGMWEVYLLPKSQMGNPEVKLNLVFVHMLWEQVNSDVTSHIFGLY